MTLESEGMTLPGCVCVSPADKLYDHLSCPELCCTGAAVSADQQIPGDLLPGQRRQGQEHAVADSCGTRATDGFTWMQPRTTQIFHPMTGGQQELVELDADTMASALGLQRTTARSVPPTMPSTPRANASHAPTSPVTPARRLGSLPSATPHSASASASAPLPSVWESAPEPASEPASVDRGAQGDSLAAYTPVAQQRLLRSTADVAAQPASPLSDSLPAPRSITMDVQAPLAPGAPALGRGASFMGTTGASSSACTPIGSPVRSQMSGGFLHQASMLMRSGGSMMRRTVERTVPTRRTSSDFGGQDRAGGSDFGGQDRAGGLQNELSADLNSQPFLSLCERSLQAGISARCGSQLPHMSVSSHVFVSSHVSVGCPTAATDGGRYWRTSRWRVRL